MEWNRNYRSNHTYLKMLPMLGLSLLIPGGRKSYILNSAKTIAYPQTQNNSYLLPK